MASACGANHASGFLHHFDFMPTWGLEGLIIYEISKNFTSEISRPVYNIYIYICIYTAACRYTRWEHIASFHTFDNQQYRRLSVPHRRPLCSLTGWDLTIIKYCSTRTVQLGLRQWVSGIGMTLHLQHNFFGSVGARAEQLKLATTNF